MHACMDGCMYVCMYVCMCVFVLASTYIPDLHPSTLDSEPLNPYTPSQLRYIQNRKNPTAFGSELLPPCGTSEATEMKLSIEVP